TCALPICAEHVGAPEQELHEAEQQGAFECGGIELHGVARRDEFGREAGGAFGEDHGPAHLADLAPEFAVDEVGDASEEQAGGGGADDEIAEVQQGLAVAAGEPGEGEGDADEAAVAGHAAVPDAQERERLGEQQAGRVEQEVAEPSADEHADDERDHEVADLVNGQPGESAARAGAQQQVGGDKTGEVGEAVVAHAEVLGEADEERVDVVNPVGGGRAHEDLGSEGPAEEGPGTTDLRARTVCLSRRARASSRMSTAMSSFSKISRPRMCSMTSSMVTTPAVEPNSSTATSSCWWVLRKTWRASATVTVSGMKWISCMCFSTVSWSRSLALALSRSRRRTRPTMSSRVLP